MPGTCVTFRKFWFFLWDRYFFTQNHINFVENHRIWPKRVKNMKILVSGSSKSIRRAGDDVCDVSYTSRPCRVLNIEINCQKISLYWFLVRVRFARRTVRLAKRTVKLNHHLHKKVENLIIRWTKLMHHNGHKHPAKFRGLRVRSNKVEFSLVNRVSLIF